MRIVGGALRGRKIEAPLSDAIRPTTDRVREALFNSLQHKHLDGIEGFEGLRILDLFSGSGALGLEALSRGASQCLFVENSSEGRGLIRTNIEKLGLTGRTKLFRRDATNLGEIGTMAPFDLLFADPPYNMKLGTPALISAAKGGWLKDQAIIVLEEAKSAIFDPPQGFAIDDEKIYGESLIRIMRFTQ